MGTPRGTPAAHTRVLCSHSPHTVLDHHAPPNPTLDPHPEASHSAPLPVPHCVQAWINPSRASPYQSHRMSQLHMPVSCLKGQ